MRSWGWILLAACLPVFADGQSGVDALLQKGVEQYRGGRILDALETMTQVLVLDPHNIVAKNYLWTASRETKESEKTYRFGPGEEKEAVRLAYRQLAERRRQVGDVLAQLRETYKGTRNVRSPEDLLASFDGMDRRLGPNFESERVGEQAETYYRNILANLAAALQNKTFIAKKDELSARAYLSYYQGDWPGALALWEEALKNAPSDATIKRNRDRLWTLVQNRLKEEKIRDASTQAATLEKTGYYAEAAEAWRDVLVLDPKNAEAARGLSACRKIVNDAERRERLKARTNEGIGLFKAGNYVEAAQVWLEVLQQDPQFTHARVWLSEVGKKMRGGQAVRSPSPSVAAVSSDKMPPDKAKAFEFYKKGIMLYSDDRVTEAVAAWKECLTLDPTLTRAKQALDQAQWELGFQKP